MIHRFVLIALMVCFCGEAFSQDPAPRPAAAKFRQRNPTLSQAVQAKLQLVDNKQQFIVMLPDYRMQQQKGQRAVTKFRKERRTRMVKGPDGKAVEQTYVVSVPYVETITDPLIPVPTGLKPKVFDGERFRYVDISGKELTLDEAAKRLHQLSSVFLLEKYRGQFKGVPELQRNLLHPDAIIVLTEDEIRKRPPEAKSSKAK